MEEMNEIRISNGYRQKQRRCLYFKKFGGAQTLPKHIKPHENIRLIVSQQIMDITKGILEELLGYSKDLEKFRIQTFLDVLSNTKSWRAIMPQEIGAVGGFVDMDYYERIIFELKGTEGELKDGLEKVKNDYIKSYPKAKYVILTTSTVWWIYRVGNDPAQRQIVEEPKKTLQLTEIYKGRIEREVNRHLKQILTEIIKEQGYKIPARPEVLAVVFRKITSYEDSVLSILQNHKEDSLVKPLIESFANIISILYSESDETAVYKLLVKHTILQMIVLASLSKALNKFEGERSIKICRGLTLDIDVSLPYLNWWYLVHSNSSNKDETDLLVKLADELTRYVELIDWEISGPEDVFRELYELFIDQDTRRAIGEYYTPPWLVQYAINRLEENSVSLKDKLILDPFCGSGTFLTMAYHRKIKEGEEPEKAIEEVVGFDINPLAVSLARAELILAYNKYETGIPRTLIFHTDTLATMFQGENVLSPHGQIKTPEDVYPGKLVELNYIQSTLNGVMATAGFGQAIERNVDVSVNLVEILKIERALGEIFREVVSLDKSEYYASLGNLLTRYLEEGRLGNHQIGGIFKMLMTERKDEFIGHLNSLLTKYGDGVWAATITSILAPIAISFVKNDIVLTNPPWLQLSKLKTNYSDIIRKEAMDLVKNFVKKGSSNVVYGSDLATMALYGAMKHKPEALAFVMPRESAFHYKTSQRSGLVLTYSVLKKSEDKIQSVDMIDIDYDVFQHGNYPTLVLIKFAEGM